MSNKRSALPASMSPLGLLLIGLMYVLALWAYEQADRPLQTVLQAEYALWFEKTEKAVRKADFPTFYTVNMSEQEP